MQEIEQIAATVLFPVAGSLALNFIYQQISTDWPESYLSVTTVVERQVRNGFLQHYVVFRGLPVFIVALFVVVTVGRLEGWPLASVLILAAAHLMRTNIRAIRHELRDVSKKSHAIVVLEHVAVIAMVLTSCATAFMLQHFAAPLVPETSDIVLAVWAGFFAALFGSVTRWLMTGREPDSGSNISRLKRDVGAKKWLYIDDMAEQFSCSSILLKAIILAEVEQRPRWIRNLERVKGAFLKSGTYGVAQVYSDFPITDRKSIQILASQWEGFLDDDLSSTGEYSGDLKARLMGHNPDSAHADRIIGHLENLKYSNF